MFKIVKRYWKEDISDLWCCYAEIDSKSHYGIFKAFL